MISTIFVLSNFQEKGMTYKLQKYSSAVELDKKYSFLSPKNLNDKSFKARKTDCSFQINSKSFLLGK